MTPKTPLKKKNLEKKTLEKLGKKPSKKRGISQNLRNFPSLSPGGRSKACTLLSLDVSSHGLCTCPGPRVQLVHTRLGCVCVVTPTKSFRVVCGNAHPAYLVLMRAQLHHEAAQIGLVWRITRRKLSGPMCSMICWIRPSPSSTTLATPYPMLRTTSRCSSNLLRTGWQQGFGEGRSGLVSSRESRSRGGGESLASSSQAASKNSARTASDHEPPWNLFANELKALADATQVLQSETCGAEEQTYSLFQECAVACFCTPRAISRGLKLWPW